MARAAQSVANAAPQRLRGGAAQEPWTLGYFWQLGSPEKLYLNQEFMVGPHGFEP